MSITQLQAYYDGKKPQRIVYDSSNNRIATGNGHTTQAPTNNPQIVTIFDSMVTMLAPNRIAFKAGKNVICFNGIVDIKLRKGDIFDVLYIYCNDTPIIYTILFE